MKDQRQRRRRHNDTVPLFEPSTFDQHFLAYSHTAGSVRSSMMIEHFSDEISRKAACLEEHMLFATNVQEAANAIWNVIICLLRIDNRLSNLSNTPLQRDQGQVEWRPEPPSDIGVFMSKDFYIRM
jgi:hypothetical protein